MSNPSNDNLRKLFIGGLNRSTTDDEVKEMMGQFGNMTDVVVIRDPSTQQSRGFGFVTYETEASTDDALKYRRDNGPFTIQGKSVEVKRAIPRDDQSDTSHLFVKKMFVGGIPSISPDEAEGYIRKWCHPDVPSSIDLLKHRDDDKKLRGFGFLEFEHEDFVDKLVIKQGLFMNGKKVEVKKAAPREMDGGRGGGAGGTRGRGSSRGGGRGGSRGGSRGGGYGGQGYNSYEGDSGYYGNGGGYGEYYDDGFQQRDSYSGGGGSYQGGGYDGYSGGGGGRYNDYGGSRYGSGGGGGRGRGGRYQPY